MNSARMHAANQHMQDIPSGVAVSQDASRHGERSHPVQFVGDSVEESRNYCSTYRWSGQFLMQRGIRNSNAGSAADSRII